LEVYWIYRAVILLSQSESEIFITKYPSFAHIFLKMPWWWRQHSTPECCYQTATLHSIKTQKTVNSTEIASLLYLTPLINSCLMHVTTCILD